MPAAVLVTESDSPDWEAGDNDESLAATATVVAAEADGLPAADLTRAAEPGAAVGEPGWSAAGPDMAADVPGVAVAGREAAPPEWDVPADAAEVAGVPVAGQRGLLVPGPGSGGAPPAPPSRRDIVHPLSAIAVRGRRRRLAALALGGAIIAAAGVISFMLLNSWAKPQGPLMSPSAAKSASLAPSLSPVTSLQFRPYSIHLPSGYSGDLISSLAFNRTGATLAIAGNPGICLWDIVAKHCTTNLITSAWSVAFSPDGKLLAAGDVNGSGASNKIIRLWNVATSQSTPLTNPKSGGAYSVACSPDNKTLAAADANGNTYLWNVVTHTPIPPLTDPPGRGANSVAFSPNGKLLAVGDNNGTTYLWNVATRKLIAPLNGPPGKIVNSVVFSYNGKLLAVGDANGSTYLWNVVTQKLIAPLSDNQGRGAYSVAFSPDGRLLAVGDINGSIYVWNVVTQKLIRPLPEPEPNSDPYQIGVNSVVFSPGGRILATGYENGSVYLWYISLRLPIAGINGRPLYRHVTLLMP